MRLHMMRLSATLLCLVVLPAGAIVFGGTNLGFGGYPAPNCSQPYMPFQFSDEWARERFASEVEEYLSCVQKNADNAENDVKRVLAARDSAIREANAFIDSL